MGKLIDKGWYKETDPFYREGWTLSVSLGLEPPSKDPSKKSVEVKAKDPKENAIRLTKGALQGTQKKRGQNKKKSELPGGRK